MKDHNWIILTTTPPTPETEFNQIVAVLNEAGIPIELKENQTRQCKNDVAFWLSVQQADLEAAWNIVRGLASQ
jgi:hypothetical protein